MPKPIVPILNRPFLLYQLDLLRRVGSVDEVILSLNYQPDRIEKLIGSLPDLRLKIRYLVEPQPMGTAGAIRFALDFLDDTAIIFNGDVLAELDLKAVLQFHRLVELTLPSSLSLSIILQPTVSLKSIKTAM